MESVDAIAQKLIPCTCGGYGENNRRHMSDCPRFRVAWEDIAAALAAERAKAETIAKNDAEDSASAGRISHDEARQMLSRFINSHFNNPGEKARATIPARPEYDDDLRMSAYIAQQRSRDAKFAAFAGPDGEPRKVLGTLPVTADGAIAIPFVSVVYHPDHPTRTLDVDVCQDEVIGQVGVPGDDCTEWHEYAIRDCYSTRTAAEAAKEKTP